MSSSSSSSSTKNNVCHTSFAVTALSPLDGRYSGKVAAVRSAMSEAALIRRRIAVEVAWFRALARAGAVTHVGPLSPAADEAVAAVVPRTEEDILSAALEVKRIEGSINHDVKAVEYFVKDALSGCAGVDPSWVESVHFALTSEDVNNVAYAGMVSEARGVVLGSLGSVVGDLEAKAREWSGIAMLARTHGQPATPTTLGKEMANFSHRLSRALAAVRGAPLLAKMNGAVGNYNAHLSAYPDADWPAIAEGCLESLDWGLTVNPYTTQIEPHDALAELLHALERCCTVLTDMCRDCWGYISLGYLAQRTVEGEVGSSTMPHKVNPIDFENAEGNAGVASALLSHMAHKLPISRFQRDLSDSTVLRNLGTAFGHIQIAAASALRGLGRVGPGLAALERDLDAHWEVLAEPIQTVLRARGYEKPYEALKSLTRGRDVDREAIAEFVKGLQGAVPAEDIDALVALTPATYLGNAPEVARNVAEKNSEVDAGRDVRRA